MYGYKDGLRCIIRTLYSEIDTYTIVPREKDYWRFEERHMVELGRNGEVKRDAFFYYLLVVNVVLLLIVFGAV